MSFVAQRLDYFDSSDFRTAIQRQALLQNPIDLSIGVPEELTPEHIKAGGIKAIQEDKTIYTPSNGLVELRQAIAHKLTTENNIHANENTVTIVPGLTTGQLLVYLAIINPGDEIVLFDPYYPPYPHLASMVGASITYVSTLPNFQPDLQALEASITHKTKAVVVNSPNNPTGVVYSEKTLKSIAAIAKKHNVLVISDEIYEHYCYDEKHFSIGSIYPNTITMNGFSKEYAMTGWRVGYIHGPSDIIFAINELQQYVTMSSSSIAQHAAVEALKHRPNILNKYQNKNKYVKSELKRLGIDLGGAEGSFFAFFKAPNDLTDLEFVDRAADNNLILVPGRAFSRLHGFIRLSYGADMHTLKRGMLALEKTIQGIK